MQKQQSFCMVPIGFYFKFRVAGFKTDFRDILTSLSSKIEIFPTKLLLLKRGTSIFKAEVGAKKFFLDFLSGKSDFIGRSSRFFSTWKS